MVAVRHLGFLKFDIISWLLWPICVTMPNFVPIGQTIGGDMADFWFLKDGGRSPSSICFTRVWTTHEEYLVVFVSVQNFGWYRCSNFDNMQLLIFCALNLKMHIHAAKIGIWFPKWEAVWTRNTFCGTWYLPHSRLHKSMIELCA